MADEVYRTRTGPSAVAWLALVLAILALIIGWMAYNRAGEDLEDQAGQAIEQTVDETEEASDDAGEAAQDAADAVEQGIDTGPDGVDDGAQ